MGALRGMSRVIIKEEIKSRFLCGHIPRCGYHSFYGHGPDITIKQMGLDRGGFGTLVIE